MVQNLLNFPPVSMRWALFPSALHLAVGASPRGREPSADPRVHEYCRLRGVIPVSPEETCGGRPSPVLSVIYTSPQRLDPGLWFGFAPDPESLWLGSCGLQECALTGSLVLLCFGVAVPARGAPQADSGGRLTSQAACCGRAQPVCTRRQAFTRRSICPQQEPALV